MPPSVPELPFIDDVLKVATHDLDASRALLQRLLVIQDALLASALTIAGLFAGLAYSNHSRALAAVGVPLVLVLGYLDGVNWVHFRRVSIRIRSLELLFHAYVKALRETKTSRPRALRGLREQVDRYQFGIERKLSAPRAKDIWRTNWRRVRWWLYAVVAVILGLSALLWVPKSQLASVCPRAPEGAITHFGRSAGADRPLDQIRAVCGTSRGRQELK